jgi:alanine dehydrogenase
MKVGTIRETKNEEYRVGLTPAGAGSLVSAGHEVFVECGAGVGSGFVDGQYEAAGARLCASADETVAALDLLVKVKELQPAEFALLRPGLLLFA